MRRIGKPTKARATIPREVGERLGLPPATESPTAAQYADIPVFLELSSPGCWEFKARVGSVERTFTVHVYN